MTKYDIRQKVLYEGCVRVYRHQLCVLFPAKTGLDEATLQAWCAANKLSVYVDPYSGDAYFNPMGIRVPLCV